MSVQVKPYHHQNSSKKEEVAEMFNNIAHRYDFLNQFLSAGIHKSWRKKAVQYFIHDKPEMILDVATGTGDFAIESLNVMPKLVHGMDISEGMLNIGKEKIKKLGLDEKIILQYGDAENPPFNENTFDVITVGFGVRNFENLELGLTQLRKILKPGGKLIILEFSKPAKWFRPLYMSYFKYITPTIGRLFSKDSRAYTYLPESVQAFPSGDEFLKILSKCGLKNCECKPLTFGIASIYSSVK